MGEAAREPGYTFAEYLALEEKSEIKHELVNGELVAMSGGTADHSRIAANMITELSLALRGRPCVVCTSDMLIRAKATEAAMYPDVSVVSGKLETDPESKYTRNDDGTWTLSEAGAGEKVRLAALGVDLPVDAIYLAPLAAAG